MVVTTQDPVKLFTEALEPYGFKLAVLGMKAIPYTEPSDEDKAYVRLVVDMVAEHLRKIGLEEIADDFKKHEEFFIRVAGVAKAEIEERPIRYPPTTNSIAVLPLMPQFIRYVASPSSTEPAYSDYALNDWTIEFTSAGEKKYILGSDTAYYKTSKTTGRRIVWAVIQDGLLEYGTEPGIIWQKWEGEGYSVWGATPVEPLKEIPIKRDLYIFRYKTLGAMVATARHGLKWWVMSRKAYKAYLPLLGLAFVEAELVMDGYWVT